MPRQRTEPTEPSVKPVQALQLRLQRALKEASSRPPQRNGRSLNAEMHARLEASFRPEDDWGGPGCCC